MDGRSEGATGGEMLLLGPMIVTSGCGDVSLGINPLASGIAEARGAASDGGGSLACRMSLTAPRRGTYAYLR